LAHEIQLEERMKRLIFGVTLLLAVAFVIPAFANIVGDLAQCKVFNLNVIAYDHCPNAQNSQRISVLASFDVSPNGQLFANLSKQNTIFLTQGPFGVLSSNACDVTNQTKGVNPCLVPGSGGACFSLPALSASLYDVAIRLVGKPGTKADPFLCATSGSPLTVVCDSGHTIKTRNTGSGNPTFVNVTSDLLFLNGTPVFDPSFSNFFWFWGTDGKAHTQVWFVDASCPSNPF
jgi:hypothetical protein